MKKTIYLMWMLPVVLLMLTQSAYAVSTGNISPTDKYAWTETSGWVNFRPANAGVMVYSEHLEGYAWAENIGWIKLGNYSGGGVHTYNNDANDWGVNVDVLGNLAGYGWSETSGWVNFHPATNQVVLNLTTGTLDGYAWGENIGWVHFKYSDQNVSYGVAVVKFTITLDQGAGGGITCPAPAIQGWDVTCSITPLPGYYVSGIVDINPVPNPGTSYTITAVSGNHTITVTFSEYLVKKLIQAGGQAYGNDPITVYQGASADDTILLREHLFDPLTMVFDNNQVIFSGGFTQPEFNDNTGHYTTIKGILRIENGAVILSNIVIE